MKKPTKEQLEEFLFFSLGTIKIALVRGDLKDATLLFQEFKKDIKEILFP